MASFSGDDLLQFDNQNSPPDMTYTQIFAANISHGLPNSEPSYLNFSGATSFSKPSTAMHVHSPPAHARRSRKIARPPNAFIMFRMDFVKKYPKIKTVEKQQKNISRVVGEAWRMLGAHNQREWYDRAAEAARQHKLDHPGYKFSPTRRGPYRVKDKNQATTSEDIAEKTKQLRESFTEFKGVAPPSFGRKSPKKVASASMCITTESPSPPPPNSQMQTFEFPSAQYIGDIVEFQASCGPSTSLASNEDLNPQGSSSLNLNTSMPHNLPFDASNFQVGAHGPTFGHGTEIGGGFALGNKPDFSSPLQNFPLNFTLQPQLVDPSPFNFLDLGLQGITYNCDNLFQLNGSSSFQQSYNFSANISPQESQQVYEPFFPERFVYYGQEVGPNIFSADSFISASS